MRLEGKTALVTGAGSGIGEATALLFAAEGADIAVNDIDLKSAERTAEAVRKAGRKALAVRADVADEKEVAAMVEMVVAGFGGIDILVNNAGIPIHGHMLEDIQTPENWDRVVDVILRGTYLCSQAVGRLMEQKNSGKIVNIASIAGTRAAVNQPSYGAAKAGVINLTKTLAVDWAPSGINVNCITPGIIDTPLTKSTIAVWSTPEQIAGRIPLGYMAEADDVARAALFLCSEEARYITGVILPVDGGMAAKG